MRSVSLYSDELTPGGSQLIAERISTDDGATWSAKSFAWQSSDPGDRPGMATVTRMGDGRCTSPCKRWAAPSPWTFQTPASWRNVHVR